VRLRVLLDLADQAMHEPCYDTLRTKQQVGGGGGRGPGGGDVGGLAEGGRACCARARRAGARRRVIGGACAIVRVPFCAPWRGRLRVPASQLARGGGMRPAAPGRVPRHDRARAPFDPPITDPPPLDRYPPNPPPPPPPSQLGYTVHSGTRLTHGVLGFCVVVVSAAHPPAEVEARVEAFLHDFRATLAVRGRPPRSLAPRAWRVGRGGRGGAGKALRGVAAGAH
jgi:hypothetical protein